MPLDLTPEESEPYFSGQAPGPHLDVIAAMATHAAAAGLRLGVFDALAEAPAPAADLAGRLGADPAALEVLLGALAATGYLARDGDRYAATGTARSLQGYGDSLLFWHDVLTGMWGGLEESVRSGKRQGDFYEWIAGRPQTLARFEGILRGQAGWLSEEIVALAPPPAGATRLLDLGGGHARYSIAYCAAGPELRATVVDLPSALVAGRAAVVEAGLEERVELRAGDLLEALPYVGQDCVLLFNLLHGFTAERAEELVRSAVGTLRPGGRAIVLERDPAGRGDPVADAFTRMFALNLHHTQGGVLHPLERIAGWLTSAGCAPPETMDLTRSPAHRLLVTTAT
ncbi:methyltransferase [Nonomuraea endophytica]|uniref:SAM-dependent methyltransferase n=1 Tax=Nonomuraea endophytica TaxID=714136 RepID=A0A7W8EML2_9ACTN|nr:class I SAM-dependent methyltransferase [Nonomuraea endophytica]MBB5084072.1 SAM-dependent methyltransferase [Nonomuraea endophytica]